MKRGRMRRRFMRDRPSMDLRNRRCSRWLPGMHRGLGIALHPSRARSLAAAEDTPSAAAAPIPDSAPDPQSSSSTPPLDPDPPDAVTSCRTWPCIDACACLGAGEHNHDEPLELGCVFHRALACEDARWAHDRSERGRPRFERRGSDGGRFRGRRSARRARTDGEYERAERCAANHGPEPQHVSGAEPGSRRRLP